MTSEIFTTEFTVPASAIDQQQHVNNLVYLKWCLETAEAHWQHKASKEQQKKYIWFVLEHHIAYKAQAILGEDILIKTWVSTAEGVRSIRHYEIFNKKHQQLLVKAHTEWCLLDAQSKRPTKIPDEIRNLFQ